MITVALTISDISDVTGERDLKERKQKKELVVIRG